MGEWWTYDIGDLVLFTPDTYFRLFEIHHRHWWPVQLGSIALALVTLLCVWLKPAWGGRAIAVALAASWAWVGWAFLHLRFAPIHWVADWYAIAFFVQALLLSLYGASRRGADFGMGHSSRAGVGAFILLGALLALPATAHLTGREWMQAELFAMTPDATTLATLGLLLMSNGKATVWLALIPLAWCLVSGATLWVLDAPEAAILAAGAGLTVFLMCMPVRRRGQSARRE